MMNRLVARRLTACAVLVFIVAACVDRGPPSTEDQMRSMGLQLDTLVRIDDHTEATVRVKDGAPELLLFTADTLGGSRLGIIRAERPTINGGMVGEAGGTYLFGAGQGPIERVEADDPHARAEVVSPEIGGWLIVVPATVGTGAIPWRLVGADGAQVYASVGTGMPEWAMSIDDRTRAYVRLREGVPELLLYTLTEVGGAAIQVTSADVPTSNGGLAGTAASPGHHYLFGAGQGQLSPNGVDAWVTGTGDQAAVSPLTKSTTIVADASHPTPDSTWLIVVPASVPIGNVRWRLTDTAGKVVFEAEGMAPTH